MENKEKVSTREGHQPKEEHVAQDKHCSIPKVGEEGREHHTAEVIHHSGLFLGTVGTSARQRVKQTGTADQQVEAPKGNHDGRQFVKYDVPQPHVLGWTWGNQDALEAAQHGS